MRVRQIIIAALLSVSVTACSDIYGYASRDTMNKVGTLNIISTGVTMATDKTLVDHFVSYRSGKDCSTVRTEQGRSYCREDEPNPMPQMYCYRSLGDVTCYTQANPTRHQGGLVGSVQ